PVSSAAGKPVHLPEKAPVPNLQKPEARTDTRRPQAERTRTPEQQPPDLAGTIPVPTPKPAISAKEGRPNEEHRRPGKKPVVVDPRSAELALAQMPADERACRQRLKAMGVEFEERKAE